MSSLVVKGQTNPNLTVVGTPVVDNFALDRVLGRWPFPIDRKFDGLLYTKILSCPYPHAKITNIDASAALALSGVMAVATYKDIPAWSQELTHQGQEVAAVAATDPDIADEAIDLINVTYSQLPWVQDPDIAATNSILSGVIAGTNILGGAPTVITAGDVSAGFAASDAIVEEDIGWSATYQHSPLITRSAVAVWGYDSQPVLTAYTVSQNPFSQRSILAGYLNLPLNQIRVITHGTAGGFGDMHSAEWICVAAVLSKMTGRPVLNALSRKDNFLQATRQYRNKAHIKLGAKADGTLMAIQVTDVTDGGGNGGFGVGDTLSPMQITYRCANMSIAGSCVCTNNPPTGAWRCVGEPGGTWTFEQVMDDLAYKLNMDPVKFRLKNLMTASEKDNATGLPFSSLAAVDNLQNVHDAIGWDSKWHAPGAKVLSDGRYHGIGVASFICNKGPVAVYGVTAPLILANRDGTFDLNLGQSNINCTAAEMCVMAAEALGVPLAAVSIGEVGDTSASQDCGMQGGSSRTGHTGNGVIAAANDLKAQCFALAATTLGVTADKLSAANGKIFVTANPTQSVTYATVLTNAANPIVGRGYNVMNYAMTTRTGSSTAVEVAVDKDTGEVEVTNAAIAEDSGQVGTAMGYLGQMRSALTQGLGFTLMWHQELDSATGFMMNPTLLDHKPITHNDVPLPSAYTAIASQALDSLGPFGAKGLCEPPQGVVACAIANAIYNAIGVRVQECGTMPIQVLKALGEG